MEINWNKVKQAFTELTSSKNVDLNDNHLKSDLITSLSKHYPGQKNDFNNYRIFKSIEKMKQESQNPLSITEFFVLFETFFIAITHEEYIKSLKN